MVLGKIPNRDQSAPAAPSSDASKPAEGTATPPPADNSAPPKQ